MAKEGWKKPSKTKRWLAKVAKGPKAYEHMVTRVFSDNAELMLRRIRFHYLTGASLHVQSDRLRSSVTKQPSTGAYKRGNQFVILIGTNVFYGEVWEFGADVPPRTIYPVGKKALRFFIKGQKVFAKKVFQQERTIEPRPWLVPGIEDGIPKLKRDLANVPSAIFKTRR